MNKHIVHRIVTIVLIVLALSYVAMAAESSKSRQTDASVAGVPNPVPGSIFAGDYLRVGINNAGSLGVTNGASTNDPGVGFQSVKDTPFGPTAASSESAAIWWWGEGYNVAYKRSDGVDKVAYWQPGYGYPPPASSNVVLVSNSVPSNTDQRAVKDVIVKTADGKLQIRFTYLLMKKYPYLDLRTTFTNIGGTPLYDIVYKRIIDWDVCTDTGNNWISTGTEATAIDTCSALAGRKTKLTIKGHDGLTTTGVWPAIQQPVVSYVDLNAWDDETVRSPNGIVQSFESPTSGDQEAAIYYNVKDLSPGQSKMVYTTYQSNFPKK